MKCPLLFVYDENPLLRAETMEDVYEALSAVSPVKNYGNSRRQVGQFARIAVISSQLKKESSLFSSQ